MNSLLSSLDYHKVLQRGFAVVRSKDGAALSSTQQLQSGDEIKIELIDGAKIAEVR